MIKLYEMFYLAAHSHEFSCVETKAKNDSSHQYGCKNLVEQ